MSIDGIIALLVVFVGIPLNVYIFNRLLGLSHARPDLRVLRERTIVAFFVLLFVVVFGLVFLNNDATIPPLSTEWTKIITRTVTLLAATVPALYWIRLYRSK
jgi:uncharacterized membrane protein